MSAIAATSVPVRVHRVEVHPAVTEPDPLGEQAAHDAQQAFGVAGKVHSARIFLIEATLTDDQLDTVARQLLRDPVSQTVKVGVSDAPADAMLLEVHYKPGVMDPVAQSTRDAIVEMLPELSRDQVEVRTGLRFVFEGLPTSAAEKLPEFASRYLANPVIQDIHRTSHHPEAFLKGTPYTPRVSHVGIRELDDAGLEKLSREGHLFLSLDEMKGIQNYYRDAQREPTDIELETLAQTWSEHCVHKTLKSQVSYRETAEVTPSAKEWAHRVGHALQDDGSIVIDNLLKRTVAAATFDLMEQHADIKKWCVSVFVDNAGIVRFDDEDAVCIKVETHNHPSAIEPYGGAATGIGGCIRDILGTGLAAAPVANTNVFAVAYPDLPAEQLPKGVIHPKRTLQQVVAGVRDYGNRMGIPTVNGAVVFHEGYLANPLVFAGCIGLIPLDKCFGDAAPGDRIIALGGRTGRDGIHGATFSSAELTDTHADEFSHAVQIGNAITQKKMADVILQARDHEGGPLFRAITDCGAGGFSSAVGEMGEKVGAKVDLENAPLKYAGLSYTEIWISEAQERMVLAVPADNVDALAKLCEAEDVEWCDLGQFGHDGKDGQPELLLRYQGMDVGKLSMHLLHEGIPMPTRDATYPDTAAVRKPATPAKAPSVDQALLSLLSHPTIASKHWIIRQYDHEVQGGSAVKPLVGPNQDGPSDAAVVRPKLTSRAGIAIGSGLTPTWADAQLADDADPYWMTLGAIDEAMRNVVCTGANPDRVAILDNFCWPGVKRPEQMGNLVRCAQACYDGAMAYRTPFVSGKDSLNNQFTTEDGRLIAIPPTLLVTALAIVPDVHRCVTMDAKAAGNHLLIVGTTDSSMGGSYYRAHVASVTDGRVPRTDLKQGPANAKAVAALIAHGHIASAHDCSEGGLLVAAAEMAFAGRIGLTLDLAKLPVTGHVDQVARGFAETPSRYLLEVASDDLAAVQQSLAEAGVPYAEIGQFETGDAVTVRNGDVAVTTARVADLHKAWLGTLDW